VYRYLGRHYPTLIATTDSCARPTSSHRLRFPSACGSLQVVTSPCWTLALPGVISANLSLRAWTPTPAAPVVHTPVSSHRTSAFPTLGPGRRLAISIQQLSYGLVFEAAVIHSCSGPQICSPPRLLLPQHLAVPGSRGFYFHAYLGLLPPRAVDMLTVRFGQLTVRGLSPLKIRSLAGCSPNDKAQPTRNRVAVERSAGAPCVRPTWA
jgi:hypothetical protein